MAMLTTIKISNLRLRTIIGVYDWEREHKQDVVINITMDYEAGEAIRLDQLASALDYKKISKKVIKQVELSRFFLLERLAYKVLKVVMADKRVKKAVVCIDKPLALSFSDSVSVTLEETRE